MRNSRYGSGSGRDNRRRDDDRGNYDDRYIYQRDYDDYNRNSWYQRGADYGPHSEYDQDYGNRSVNRDDRNIFQRTRDVIRDGWNDITDRDKWNDTDYYRNQDNVSRRNSYYGSGRNHNDRNDHDRNFFERAGEKIRDKWNDWTDRDNDRDEDRYNWGSNSHYRNNSDRYNSRRYENYGRGNNNSYNSYNDRDNDRTNYNRNGNYNDAQYGAYGRDDDRYGDENYYNGSKRYYSGSNDQFNGQTSYGYGGRRRNRLDEPKYSY